MIPVYFIPGVAGSQLAGIAPLTPTYWIDYAELALGGIIALGLAPDGVNVTPPCQIACAPGPPLAAYYSEAIAALSLGLPANYTVIPWGWDWRRDLIAAGTLLAAAIVQSATAQQPAVIVGHSAGGLVARVAWSILTGSGQSNLVSRIITLGTPHQGSYSVVQLFSGGNSTLLGLSALTAISSAILGTLPAPGPLCAASGLEETLAVVLTWPAFYELLPFLGSPDAATDPNRPLLYSASNWTQQSLSQSHLDYASGTWDVLMSAAASMPPANVLTTVAGYGLTTPDILTTPKQLGTVYAYGQVLSGDGAVTVEDALVPASVQYLIQSAHQDIPLAFAQSGMLAAEVQAARPSPITPPPVDMVPGTLVQSLGAPPYTALNVLGGRGLTAMGGDC